jgi:hypothetical protein
MPTTQLMILQKEIYSQEMQQSPPHMKKMLEPNLADPGRSSTR